MSEKIALVLDGGGFNGAKAVGIAKSLWQRGKIPQKIQGVSVGAINAAKLVESGADALEKGWIEMASGHHHDIFKIDWFKLFFHPKMWLGSDSFYKDDGLLMLIGKLDPQKIIDSPIELELAMNNETDGKMEILSSRDELFRRKPELILQAVKASSSLTGLFPPVEIEGKFYSDGYHFHLDRISGFDTVFIVLNDDPLPKVHPQSNKFRRLFAGFSRVLDDAVNDKIERFLHSHGDEFREFKVSSQDKALLRMADNFKNLVQRAMDKVLGKGLMVVVKPKYSIPTLELGRFEKTVTNHGLVERLGDLETAMKLSYEQSEELMKEIYPKE